MSASLTLPFLPQPALVRWCIGVVCVRYYLIVDVYFQLSNSNRFTVPHANKKLGGAKWLISGYSVCLPVIATDLIFSEGFPKRNYLPKSLKAFWQVFWLRHTFIPCAGIEAGSCSPYNSDWRLIQLPSFDVFSWPCHLGSLNGNKDCPLLDLRLSKASGISLWLSMFSHSRSQRHFILICP